MRSIVSCRSRSLTEWSPRRRGDRRCRPSSSPETVLSTAVSLQVPSSRRLEQEARRNVEVMSLLGTFKPDHETHRRLFRKDNGRGRHYAECVPALSNCTTRSGTAKKSVAISGSRYEAVNNRDKSSTQAKVERRRKRIGRSMTALLTPTLTRPTLQEPSERSLTDAARGGTQAKLDEMLKRTQQSRDGCWRRRIGGSLADGS